MNNRLSRYSIIFSRDDHYLVYNSRRNSFYELSKELYEFLLTGVEDNNLSKEDNDILESLRSIQILTSEEEDDLYFNEVRLLDNLRVYNTTHLDITILPTIKCNLSCPYCFEQKKPSSVMSKKTCDDLIRFIKKHKFARTYSLTWFGGEPLLALDRINYLLNKLPNSKKLTRVSHSIVTNGTLITPEVINTFKEHSFDSIQITLDGAEESHNKKRFFSDRGGTFRNIIENIKALAESLPDLQITLRVNVDNTNYQDYLEVYNLVRKELNSYRNIGMYPGILRANPGCTSSSFFNSSDLIRFNKMLNDSGFKSYGYPSLSSKGCIANKLNSYVIGPKGEIYKYWEHVGLNEYVIGNITADDYSNKSLLFQYLSIGNCLNDEKCRKCPLLPICSGGCAYKRVKTITGVSSHQLCTVYNDNDMEALKDLLFNYFKEQIS